MKPRQTSANSPLAANHPVEPPVHGLAAAMVMLFASGAAALIYQILWVRQLSLVVGVDVYAVTVAVSGFFAGLSAGSYIFGQRAERTQSPLWVYALLEVSIALTGSLCTVLLNYSPALFVTLERTVGWLAWGLPFLLVGLPATLMGGTLPLLVQAFVRERDQLGIGGGRLYAANTAGAIVGTLLTAYFLIPALGILGSSLFAATLNLISGGLAFSHQEHHKFQPSAQSSSSPVPNTLWLGMVLYGIAGGIALGYEVVWSQIVVQWTSTRSFAFATVLAVYLGGLALGSRLGAWGSKRTRDRWGSFGFLIAGAGMIALVQMLSLGGWLDGWQTRAATAVFQLTGSEQLAMSGRFLLVAGCIMFVPALFLGAAFPIALRLNEAGSAPGRETGRLLAANTLGGIIGTLITGFVLVPTWGAERSLGILAIGAGVVGAIAGCYAQWSFRKGIAATCVIIMIAAFLVSPEQFSNLQAARRKGQLIYHAAGSGGAVAVIEQGQANRKFRRLYIQGVSNSGDSMTSLRYMRLQALLPLLIHRGEPKSALVIGLGTGITAGSLLSYEGLDRRVCAELLPEVISAASHFEGNGHVTSDPRMQIRRVDGRHLLLRESDTYDLITLEPPPPSAAGVANLYSTEFYRLASTRLTADGIVAQWLPLPTQNDADTRSLVRSFVDVFPHASLWTTELHEMLLIGSPEPLQLDATTIQRRFDQPTVRASLTEVGIASPAALLATYVCDRAGLVRYAQQALPVTDDRPRIEYGPWTVPGEFPRTFQNIMSHRSEPTVLNADSQLRSDIVRERTTLGLFYSASIAAYQRDRQAWKAAMDATRRAAPENPYYRWFAIEDEASGP